MKSVCIDIDGTISRYIEWVDSKTFGEVLPHCAQTIHHLKADGWQVIIYTTRGDKKEIANFLEANNVPYDAINENPNQPENAKDGKPLADVYVDDRAIHFDGDWEGVYDKISNFRTWEEQPEVLQSPTTEYCKDFLVEDFAQSMEVHRHYDAQNWQITKFSFGEILVAIGVCWTIYSMGNNNLLAQESRWLVIGIIGLASWLFGMMSVYTIVKNRAYFIRTSRHINELRHLVLQLKPFGFQNQAHFWDDYRLPKVRDWRSSQFVSLYMLLMLLVFLAYATGSAFFQYINVEGGLWLWIFVILTVALWLLIVFKAVKETF